MTRHVGIEKTAGDALVIDLKMLLSLEPDAKTQQTLRRIFVEEADKLAETREELERSTRLVREGKERLERLRRMKAHGANLNDRGLLGTMEVTQKLFENFHRRLRDEVPCSVKLQDAIVGVCATLDEARRRAQQLADANPETAAIVVNALKASETFCPKC